VLVVDKRAPNSIFLGVDAGMLQQMLNLQILGRQAGRNAINAFIKQLGLSSWL
jgi:hypothetical protein